MDAEKLLTQFVNQMTATFGNNIKSITLCGSYVRGDNTEDSDMDVYCLFENLSSWELIATGKIVRNLPSLYSKFELNLQCLTLDEYTRQGFGRAFVTPIKYFESKVLYGEDFGTKPSKEEFIPLFENIISEVIMSIRHYITAQEPVENLVDGRLKGWVLKPLCVALRIERYIIIDNYPRNFNEILHLSSGLPQTKAVEWILDNEKINQDITLAPTEVLLFMLEIATGISKRVADFKDNFAERLLKG
ncbi:nucleotidyltransferase domain-containing protein [Paenibacillus eucommiae]|uniref:Nucleotidyltransferase n=1 Tax=Paenibacillus eucommiae TaxID=1355755 RepID=A0ABS4IRB4_9BACL|nr:nucleotidyltransferase domain-containing protein [Paenibacillus eucommiae]MBP1989551.1 putative nucleotidyltransferase [Paenibacillus eucommiae]